MSDKIPLLQIMWPSKSSWMFLSVWRCVLAVSPGARDVCETADRTVWETSVDDFKVTLGTETLNTTWGRSDHMMWLFLNTDWTRRYNRLDCCYLVLCCEQFRRQTQLQNFTFGGGVSCHAHTCTHKDQGCCLKLVSSWISANIHSLFLTASMSCDPVTSDQCCSVSSHTSLTTGFDAFSWVILIFVGIFLYFLLIAVISCDPVTLNPLLIITVSDKRNHLISIENVFFSA